MAIGWTTNAINAENHVAASTVHHSAVAAGQKQVIPRVHAGMLSNLGYPGPIKVPVMDGDETLGQAHYRASC